MGPRDAGGHAGGLARRGGPGDREGPGDRRHRDLEDRQCLREPGRGPAAAAAGRRGRDGPGRRASGGRGRCRRSRTRTIDAFVAEFQANFAASAAEAGGAPGAASRRGRRPAAALPEARRTRTDRRSSSSMASAAISTTGCSTSRPLAESHTTYAIDLPGHGGSTKEVGDGRRRRAGRGRRATSWTALGIAKAHLVGHSLGGASPRSGARPSRPRRLGHGGRPAGLGPEISMEYIDGFIGTSRARKLKPVLEMLVYDPDLVTGDMVEDVLKYKRLDGVDAALNKIAGAPSPAAARASQLKTRLGEIKVPVQVIWGREDRIVPVAHSEGLPASVKVTVLDQAGHLVHMEKAGRGQRADRPSRRVARAGGAPIYDVGSAAERSRGTDWEGLSWSTSRASRNLARIGLAPSASQRIGHAASAAGRRPGLDAGAASAAVRARAAAAAISAPCWAACSATRKGCERHQAAGAGRQPDGCRWLGCPRRSAARRCPRFAGQRCDRWGGAGRAGPDRHVGAAEGHGRRQALAGRLAEAGLRPMPATSRLRSTSSPAMPRPSCCCGP